MNALTKLTLMTVIGLAVLLFAIPAAAVDDTPDAVLKKLAAELPGGQGTDWGNYYDPAGTWFGSNDLGMTYLVDITPLNLWHRRFSVVSDGVNDPTLGGFFPTIVDAPGTKGEMVRTGCNTYDVTVMTYGVDADYQIVLFAMVNGTIEMTSSTTFEWTMYMGLFAPEQDPFGSEDPLYGCIGPFSATYTKMPILPPCEP